MKFKRTDSEKEENTGDILSISLYKTEMVLKEEESSTTVCV
jgi:hypothetical protein